MISTAQSRKEISKIISPTISAKVSGIGEKIPSSIELFSCPKYELWLSGLSVGSGTKEVLDSCPVNSHSSEERFFVASR